MYESPTINFLSAVIGGTYGSINELETNFWRGLWGTIFTIFLIAVFGGLIYGSITINKWIGLGPLAFIAFVEIMTLAGIFFRTILGE